MNRRTKALSISPAVKKAVWERDGGCCVLCGTGYTAAPNAHDISRAQGGKGIEKNTVTMCASCHRLYDQSTYRNYIRSELAAYLRQKYENWTEEELYYKK